MNISHLFSSSFTGYQSNSASNLRSYCWYTRRSTDLHLSTSRSCSCLINPDAIYDQKLRAFWMSLGLDSNLEIALSPLVHRDYGMRFHNTWRILHRVRPSRSVSKQTFSGSPIEAFVDYDSNYDNVQRFWTFYEWKRRYINSNYYYYPHCMESESSVPASLIRRLHAVICDPHCIMRFACVISLVYSTLRLY